MHNKEITDLLRKNIALLSDTDCSKYPYIPQQDSQLPRLNSLRRIIELVKAIVFPGYFGEGSYCSNMQEYFIGVRVEELYGLLSEEIGFGLQSFAKDEVPDVRHRSEEIAMRFIDALPELKRVACTDVKAVYDGDKEYSNANPGTGVTLFHGVHPPRVKSHSSAGPASPGTAPG